MWKYGEKTTDKGEIEVKRVNKCKKGRKKPKREHEEQILGYPGKGENIIFHWRWGGGDMVF